MKRVLAGLMLMSAVAGGVSCTSSPPVPPATRPQRETRVLRGEFRRAYGDSVLIAFFRLYKTAQSIETTMRVSDELRVLVDGQEASLNDLRTGEEVTLTLDGPTRKVQRIEAIRTPATQSTRPASLPSMIIED